MANKVYTQADVASHNKREDLWIIVEGGVYDLTDFLSEHPGGSKILLGSKVAGQDATSQFQQFHNASILQRVGGPLKIGQVDEAGGDESAGQALAGANKTAATSEMPRPPRPSAEARAGTGPRLEALSNAPLGRKGDDGDDGHLNLTPWAEIPAVTRPSPYYNDSHRIFRNGVRAWHDEHLEGRAHEYDEAGVAPVEIYQSAVKTRLMLASVALGLKDDPEWREKEVFGVKIKDFDSFHDFIMQDELHRCGSSGLPSGVFVGTQIGLPPVRDFAEPELRSRVMNDVLVKGARICLAITEPSGGSDVQGLLTTAEKVKHPKTGDMCYKVSGQKKWITTGVWCDYFTTAVRTGPAGSGAAGVSFLLIDKRDPLTRDGIELTRMKVGGLGSSGTTLINFSDCYVPVGNLIGEENQGFKYIMYNFNHERMIIGIAALRLARVCLSEAMEYTHRRSTFGKKLIQHDVIRNQLAHAARKVESGHAWAESLVYQCEHMSKEQGNLRLGGETALFKAHAALCMKESAELALHAFGGPGYTRGEGAGGKVERISRDVGGFIVPGGSEAILLDLSVRQAIRVAQGLGAKL